MAGTEPGETLEVTQLRVRSKRWADIRLSIVEPRSPVGPDPGNQSRGKKNSGGKVAGS